MRRFRTTAVFSIVVILLHSPAFVTCVVSTANVPSADSHDSCCSSSCRVDCGFPGITENQCLGRGCCYDPYPRNGMGPWCYRKNCKSPADDTCASNGLNIGCGNFETRKVECEARGCCWKTRPADRNQQRCFFPNVPLHSYTACCPFIERRECGYCGIGERECVGRGCCWVPSLPDSGTTSCFKKNCHVQTMDTCDPEADRIDCGYNGIDRVLCEDRKCCWHPTEGAPWCYFKNGILPESTRPGEKDLEIFSDQTNAHEIIEESEAFEAVQRYKKEHEDPESEIRLDLGAFARRPVQRADA